MFNFKIEENYKYYKNGKDNGYLYLFINIVHLFFYSLFLMLNDEVLAKSIVFINNIEIYQYIKNYFKTINTMVLQYDKTKEE
jgi:hypothetical protein